MSESLLKTTYEKIICIFFIMYDQEDYNQKVISTKEYQFKIIQN
jgi:hypothetical protein